MPKQYTQAYNFQMTIRNKEKILKEARRNKKEREYIIKLKELVIGHIKGKI